MPTYRWATRRLWNREGSTEFPLNQIIITYLEGLPQKIHNFPACFMLPHTSCPWLQKKWEAINYDVGEGNAPPMICYLHRTSGLWHHCHPRPSKMASSRAWISASACILPHSWSHFWWSRQNIPYSRRMFGVVGWVSGPGASHNFITLVGCNVWVGKLFIWLR